MLSNKVQEALKSGLIGAVVSGSASALVTYFAVGMPAGMLENAANNGVSGFISGLMSGFMGVLILLSRYERQGRNI